MRAEAAIEFQEALHQERRQQKRDGQTERINAEQQNPFYQRVLFAGEGQDRGQDGAEARRPTEGEGEADDECAKRRTAALHAMQSRVGVKRFDLEDPRQVQAKNNDDHAGHDRERVLIAGRDLSDFGGDRSERDEYHAEAKDEPDGIHHDAAHELCVRRLQFLDTGA